METQKGPQVPDVENISFYDKIISSTIIIVIFNKVRQGHYFELFKPAHAKLIGTNISVRHLLFECVYT